MQRAYGPGMRTGLPTLLSAMGFVAAATACPADSESPLITQIDDSERIWQELEQQHGSTYWYAETSCGQGTRDIARVQVVDGRGALLGRWEESGACQPGEPYRYEVWGADTFPQMLELCRDLIRRGYDTAITFDGDGVLKSCRALDSATCHDACDHGWHIAERGFGLASDD